MHHQRASIMMHVFDRTLSARIAVTTSQSSKRSRKKESVHHSDIPHLQQVIGSILLLPSGKSPRRRTFSSDCLFLVDSTTPSVRMLGHLHQTLTSLRIPRPGFSNWKSQHLPAQVTGRFRSIVKSGFRRKMSPTSMSKGWQDVQRLQGEG